MGKQQTFEEKRRRMQEIREMLIRTLKEDPGSFKSLAATDTVAVAAHFEDSNELDKAKRTKTIVLKILKRDLDTYKNSAYEEFKKRVVSEEY